MAVRGREEVYASNFPHDKGWMGGPLFIRIKKYGKGSENKGSNQRRHRRALPSIVRCLAQSVINRRRK